MTERTPPLHQQNATTHTAAGDRSLIQSLYGGREGVTDGGLTVAQNGTPNMSVNVAAGRAVVLGDDSGEQQLYHIWNDGTVNKMISAADPTNPRRDLVIAEVRDTLYGGAANDWRIRVVTGTPAGSPADPATPNNAIVLARVAVAAAATSITNANITDLRRQAGGTMSNPILCTSTTRPTQGLFTGMHIYETNTGTLLVYAGATAGFRPPWNLPWGRVAQVSLTSLAQSITSAAMTDVTGASITFTAVAGRRYRLTAKLGASGSSSNLEGSLRIATSGNTEIEATALFAATIGRVAWGTMHTDVTPPAGSVTYKLRAQAVSTTLDMFASPLSPITLCADDVGPSANPT